MSWRSGSEGNVLCDISPFAGILINRNLYLKIVPAHSFGLGEKELLPNEELKKFLGY